MINKYPYTDFHELNLDWFLAQFKQLKDDWTVLAADNAEFKATMTQKFDTLDHTVQTFTTFVSDYFDNLDVQQEINNKLNEMVADGTLDDLLQPYVDTLIPSTVTAWLDDNVNPVGSAVMIDKTLSISGSAADAAVAGDLRKGFNAQGFIESWAPAFTKGSYVRGADGSTGSNNSYARSTSLTTGNKRRAAVILDSATYEMYVSYYGPNGAYTPTDYLGYSGWGSKIWYVNHVAKFAITFRRVDQATITDSDVAAFQSSLYMMTFTDTSLTVNGGAADARETGLNVQGLNKQLHDYYRYYNNWTQGSIDASGNNQTSSSACRTTRIYNRNIYSYIDISIPAGYKMATYVYDDVGNYLYSYDYATVTAHIIFTGLAASYRLVLRKIDGTAFTPSAIAKNSVSTILKVDVSDLDAYVADNSVTLAASAADVYSLYDDLVTAYPAYVSKAAKSSGGTTLYEYTFTTGDYNDNSGMRGRNPVIKKPLCLLTAGVHGNEKSAVMGMYAFCRALCTKDYRLADLAESITFKVIPLVCPDGFDADTRTNANGVNINRNFASSTWQLTSPGVDYSGAAPGDQEETQIVQNWLTANKNDAAVYIDWHNSMAYLNEISSFLGKYDSEALKWKKLYLIATNKIIPYWANVRRLANNDIMAYTGGGILPDSATGSAASYGRDLDIPTFTMETSKNVDSTGDHSNFTIGIGVEAFANMMLGFKPFWDEI